MVLERGFDPVLAVLSDYLTPGGDGYHDSERVVRRVMELLALHPHLPRLILHETLSGGERLSPLLRRDPEARPVRGARRSDSAARVTHAESLQQALRDFRRLFGVAIGTPTSLARYAERLGNRWLQKAAATAEVLPG